MATNLSDNKCRLLIIQLEDDDQLSRVNLRMMGILKAKYGWTDLVQYVQVSRVNEAIKLLETEHPAHLEAIIFWSDLECPGLADGIKSLQAAAAARVRELRLKQVILLSSNIGQAEVLAPQHGAEFVFKDATRAKAILEELLLRALSFLPKV